MAYLDRATASRDAKLIILAQALGQLADRIRSESADVGVALAIRDRFGPAIEDIRTTRVAVISQLIVGRLSADTVTQLQASLAAVVEALTYPLPRAQVIPMTRPAARRARRAAGRLSTAASVLLGGVAKAMAVGVAAAALHATPAAAACTVNGSITVCDGDQSGGVFYAYPNTDDLTVHNLTTNIAAPTIPSILFGTSAASGSNGAPFKNGDGGSNAVNVKLTVSDADNTVFGNTYPAIFVINTGGGGGSGGNGGAAGSAGSGAQGGNAGGILANIDIDVTTSLVDSDGIIAISAGGNGGNGGDFYVGVGTAGNGGAGGAGGTVTVNYGAHTITTTGKSSDGIFASSTGGGGGAAGGCNIALCGSSGGGNSAVGGAVTVTTVNGTVINVTGEYSKGIRAVSIGGFAGNGGVSYFSAGFASNGGSAGDGGSSTVVNNGRIQTGGLHGDAIFAQSIGGGGGDGGDGGIAITGLGGNGAQGGNGGAVSVTNSATGVIVTQGNFARGIVAESIGGGGGDGGSAFALIAVGGNGSNTSHGGTVNVVNAGSITTQGQGSHTIFAQSVGGGGGDGGDAGGLAAVGGTAGGGGDGAAVDVNNSGFLTTSGVESFAIVAQSVGGGGGNGGGTGGLVSVGGTGGLGGDGSTVTVTNSGQIRTGSDRSLGILAQSVGGGGGNGGGAASAGAFVSVSVGGTGGDGGDGEKVTVTTTSSSDIRTQGERSWGIFAQSVGGGGGNGGYGAGGALGVFGAVNVAVGGTGGDGGIGGEVVVNTAGYVSTAGPDAGGVHAQSVGGGGGTGGFSLSLAGAGGKFAAAGAISVGGSGGLGGDGGAVTVTNGAMVDTTGDRSVGVLAQSVGGGGGSGGWSSAIAGAGGAIAGAISVSVGGTGAGGGDGAAVVLGNTGQVHTTGEDSDAIFAQSVGGGGGNGGFSVAGAAAGGKTSGAAALSVGGFAAGGGDAGTVTVTSSGLLITEGDRAAGITAQSLGGGGGIGGWSGALGASGGALTGSAALSIGGGGGAGGDSSTVIVTSSSNIQTSGYDASGIFAQSVGGGGGRGGFSLGLAVGAGTTGGGATINVGGFGGGGGDGGIVTVTSSGTVITSGDRARAITAQSIGGGGGDGGFTGAIAVGAGTTGASANVGVGGSGGVAGDGKTVTLTNTGQVQTSGFDATALVAQSVGGGGGNGGFSAALGVAAGTNAGSGSITVGGFGGAAGDGGQVTLNNSNTVRTFGDYAHGMVAQSVGGGGGNGGAAGNFSAAFSSSTPVTLGLSMGGFGAAGGNGGIVSLTSSGGVRTEGDFSVGVVAQSIGGGGGTGGFSITGALSAGGSNSIALTASVGGFGGAAGDGDIVTLQVSGPTVTLGESSYGIFAQSVGGGGGMGGWAGALSGALSGTKSVGIAATVGGHGGAGGNGDEVRLTSNGTILTLGDEAHGIFAQSVGGGGGVGGFTVGAVIGVTKAVNVSVGLGGFGGAGGTSAKVDVTSTNTINTKGDGAIGILAQSIGGGGGAGGSAGALSFAGSNSINFSSSVGGVGGNGNVSGDVEVENSGAIWTTGELAYGIFAQSVGGGGGHGGMVGIDENEWSNYLAGGAGSFSFGTRSQNISATVGGIGGVGNAAGDVLVRNTANLLTEGEQASVIYAQSVGGGGGDGGVATSASGAFGAGKNGTYSVALGGNGGIGGDGGLVQVFNDGGLHSLGDGGHALVAQSVGGGGGSGGDARGFALSFSPKKAKGAMSVSVSLGGYGGAAGDGGDVYIDNKGVIVTDGGVSVGILAQSIGGGGGEGGLISTQGEEIGTILTLISKGDAKGGQIAIGGSGGAAGDGGMVTVLNNGLVWTKGYMSYGVFAQSVGGGGGLGGQGLAGEISIGGQGAAAGNGGKVIVTNNGIIITEGSMAQGIFAQSVGGGGGVGGATDFDGDPTYAYRQELSATMSVVGNVTKTINTALSFGAPAFGVGIGGMGGAAGDGGEVIVTNTGAIFTSGDLATGITAQSVGGGGGKGGEGILTGVGQVVFSGLGGSAGDGGDVTVTNTGNIVTDGYGAYGILAQSVGGGGGMAGDYSLGLASWGDLTAFGGINYSNVLDLQVNPFHNNGGDGGDVTVINTGNITVNGDGAIGIFAQSVGGGGGLFGGKLGLAFAGSMEGLGTGGTVTIVQNGNIVANGKNAIGAFIQSASGQADGDITATFNGVIKGGGVYGMGVLIDGGANNLVTLNGATWADSNLAVTGTTGNDKVIANGGIMGNIDLGGGNNAFTNNNGSTFISLDYVKLNGGAFTNGGLTAPGGSGKVQVTQVTGGFVQTATGVFHTDLDLKRTGLSGEIDQLKLTNAIDIKGKFVLGILNPGYAKPGSRTVAILDGSSTLVSSGLVLDKPNSVIASFNLATTAQDLNLVYNIDFSPTGLNLNQTAVGDHINAIQTAGSSPTFAPVAAELFFVSDMDDLRTIYDSFSPETYAVQAATLTLSGQQFADNMMTCPRSSGGVVMAQGGCVWVKPAFRRLELGATSQALGYSEDASGLAMGFEAAVGDGLRIGMAVSGEDVSAGIEKRTRAEGDRYQIGGVMKKEAGPWTVGLALHYGKSDMDTERRVILPSGPLTAEATQAMSYAAATARVSYRWGTEEAYLKPMVEISRISITTDAFTEKGAGALNLVALEQTSDFTRYSFKVEAGKEFQTGSVALRPYGRAGVSYTPDTDGALFGATFAGAPGAASHGFNVDPGLDETTFDAELGVTFAGKGVSGRIGWTGQFGDRTDSQTLAVKLSLPF